MWQSQTKQDLIIEVWEKLDCESVGREEIEAIEIVVREQLGASAVDGPMIMARLLADEGAVLRHPEILKLDVKRRLETPYAAMFRNILNVSGFKNTISTIRRHENLRKKFLNENDKEGMRLVRQSVLRGKEEALNIAENEKIEAHRRAEQAEIAEWLTIWLGSPEIFDSWVTLRQDSKDFKSRFPDG
jgi:hypothetical protein